jgi:hypothetical protein
MERPESPHHAIGVPLCVNKGKAGRKVPAFSEATYHLF